ncbi:adenylosuccinate lyase family protein [soil metagenome]
MRAAYGSASDARLPDHGLRALLSIDARRQRYLDVEAALAAAQADVGLVPAAAADAIAASARLELLDARRLDGEQARTGHVMVPIIGELARVVGVEHGGWVHWGATTQNIQQTGDVLGIRAAHGIITDLLVEVLTDLAGLADRYAGTVMAGRTHAQQAVPITFGYKVAAWADAMLRHRQRLDELPPRLFIAMAGGATGTFAAMGPSGPAVQDALAERLGLVSMPVASRSIADPFAELVCTLALLSTATSTIAEEISRLAAVEFGELAETLPEGDVGSSTMPQKRNSKLCGEIVTIGAQIRSLVPLALEAVIHSHEVDGARSAMMDEAVEQALILSCDALIRLHDVLVGLQVFPDRMRANLDLTDGAIMAEATMMALAETLGRQHAHEAVHRAATLAATTGQSFTEIIGQDPAITSRLTPAQIHTLMDPATHTGHGAAIARRTAERIRTAIAERIADGTVEPP